MKLVQVNIFKDSTPFVLRFRSSHLSRFRAESILVELAFENGISGWGESAPRSYVTGETQETVIELTKRIFAGVLLGREIEGLNEIRQVLDQLEEACRAEQIPGYNSALGAIDLALLDAWSKKRNLSFPDLMRPPVRDKIPFSLSIPLHPLPEIERLFPEIVRGMDLNMFKIVMGPDPDENYRRVGLVRSLAPDAEIRIDANGNWTVPQALESLARLKAFRFSAVEQPVEPRDLEGLRTIREAGFQVIVDESMCSLSDARKLVEAEACDILNIKISKCGGLLRSFDIADYAEAEGIPCQIGSHVGETIVLNRAGLYFAAAIPLLTLYEGCSPLLFGCNPATGKANRPSGPDEDGLKINPNELELVLSLP